MVGELGEDLVGGAALVGHLAETALPPAPVVLGRGELDHVGEGLLDAVHAGVVELEREVLRGQLQQGGGDGGLAALARLIFVQAAGVGLEDEEVLEGHVGERGVVVADRTSRRRQVRAQPIGHELDFHFPSG